MRFLLGIVVGIGLTIGGAYIYDSDRSARRFGLGTAINARWSIGTSSNRTGTRAPRACVGNGTGLLPNNR